MTPKPNLFFLLVLLLLAFIPATLAHGRMVSPLVRIAPGDEANNFVLTNGPTKNFPCAGNAPGPIQATYTQGQTVNISWTILQPHEGSCFIDMSSTGKDTKFVQIAQIDNCANDKGTFSHDVQLPADIACDKCTMRFRWVASIDVGNFISCADVTINATTPAPSETATATATATIATATPNLTAQDPSTPKSSSPKGSKPKASKQIPKVPSSKPQAPKQAPKASKPAPKSTSANPKASASKAPTSKLPIPKASTSASNDPSSNAVSASKRRDTIRRSKRMLQIKSTLGNDVWGSRYQGSRIYQKRAGVAGIVMNEDDGDLSRIVRRRI